MALKLLIINVDVLYFNYIMDSDIDIKIELIDYNNHSPTGLRSQR